MIQSPVESLLPVSTTPASPGTPGLITLQAKSYLSNDPALVVLYKQLRDKTLQTLKGASQIPPLAEWNFILRNARLYDRMGCDLLALDLVRHWEFLQPPPPPTLPSKGRRSIELRENGVDYRQLLRRRSSLVVADLPLVSKGVNQASNGDEAEEKEEHAETGAAAVSQKAPKTKPKPPPTMFNEPDANSLLDSFGF